MKTTVLIILTAFAACASAQGTDAQLRVSAYLLTIQSGKHIQVVKTTDTLVVDSIASIYVPCFSVTNALAKTPFAEYRTKTHTLYIEKKTSRKAKKFQNK